MTTREEAMTALIDTSAQYRHYKGALYRYLMTGRLSEDRDTQVVIYWSEERKAIWVRPLEKAGADSWTDQVVWPDGVTRPRFIPEIAP